MCYVILVIEFVYSCLYCLCIITSGSQPSFAVCAVSPVARIDLTGNIIERFRGRRCSRAVQDLIYLILDSVGVISGSR